MKRAPSSPPTAASRQHDADNDANPQNKVVRDGFSMPCEDYRLLEEFRMELLPAGIAATKSVILRAGLHALMRLPKESRVKTVAEMPSIKTGRPPSRKDR